MLILSWNVAGLGTTVNRIHDQYGSLSCFFGRHGADIVCLQEHKIPKVALQNRAEPRQCAANCKEYESFWSCCQDDSAKGMNGVVTYAVKGSVVSADAAPLGDAALDKQGRCVRTDHCFVKTYDDDNDNNKQQVVQFCIFNVYVPCPNGPNKLKFLRALRRAMAAQREKGKAVILIGDLNITAGKLDFCWKDRVVYINEILQEESAMDTDFPKWKRDVQQHWPKIAAAMETQQVVATQTTNSRTSATYNKFRLVVTVPTNDENARRVFLGNHEIAPDYCTYRYQLESLFYEDDDTGETILAREDNVVGVGVLAELMLKIAGVEWSETLQRHIADNFAEAERHSPTRKWLKTEILHQDGMIDAFRHFYPTAEGRFTCWNQNKNRRYVNDGSRLDYTLIDASLLPLLQQGESVTAPRCPTTSTQNDNADDNTNTNNKEIDPLSEQAALMACTANGLFEPVSFEGGGMVESTREALDTMFGVAHTGHIYTPPTFSDHIAVSVLLNADLARHLTLNNDVGTRKAQPHTQQRSVASFFSKAAPAAASKNGNNNSKPPATKRLKTTATSKKKKIPASSVLHHFRRTSGSGGS